MATPADSNSTVSDERSELVDALRGVALSAVLLVNLYSLSLTAFFPAAERAGLPTAGFDNLFHRWVLPTLLHHKALTLLSLLFGWGFSVQLQRARGGGVAVLARRATALLALGLVHTYLLWWGDILLVYALLAFLLIPFRRASEGVLLWAGLGVCVVLPAAISPWMDGFAAQLLEQKKADVFAANLTAFRGSSYGALLHQNASFRSWVWIALWSLLPFIFGRFLLGAWAAQKPLLQDPLGNKSLLWRLFFFSALFGAAATAIELGQAPLQRLSLLATGLGAFALRAVVLAAPLALGVAYGCGFALLFLRPTARRYLRALAPFGRMALTHYLTQTVVGVALFYGIGLGVGPRYGFAAELVVWAVLFGLQLVVSGWWLARFRLGPVEWLWRSVTYARLQPLRR